MSPRRKPTATAWALDRAWSFARMCLTWLFTVSSERKSLTPISRLTRPSEISCSTSISRTVGCCSSSLRGWNGITSATVASRRAATDSNRAECSRYLVRIALRSAASTALVSAMLHSSFRKISPPIEGGPDHPLGNGRDLAGQGRSLGADRHSDGTVDESRLVVDARPDLTRLHEHLTAVQPQGQFRIVRDRERLEDLLGVDRREPAGEVARAGDVLGPLGHHRAPNLGSLAAEARHLRINGIEADPLEQDVRRGVVREREHQERAATEAHRRAEAVSERPRHLRHVRRLIGIDARAPEGRCDE